MQQKQIDVTRPTWIDAGFERWLHSHPLQGAPGRCDAYLLIDSETLEQGIAYVQCCAHEVTGLSLPRQTALEMCTIGIAYERIDRIEFRETLYEALKAYLRTKGAQA